MHGNALASHTSEKLGFLDSKNAAYFGLVLQKVTAVNIDQADAFGPIMITKGPNFDKCVL